MRLCFPFLAALILCSLPQHVRAAEAEKIPLNVLYLGRQDDGKRTDAFVEFLAARFVRCISVKREEFNARMLPGVDVVLLDWSQQERATSNYPSPIGPLENWETPTVLLGSAGQLIAGPWSVIGGAG
jgi:hypothetical protein